MWQKWWCASSISRPQEAWSLLNLLLVRCHVMRTNLLPNKKACGTDCSWPSWGHCRAAELYACLTHSHHWWTLYIQTYCSVTLQFFPLKGRVYFPTPWITVTYFGQLNVAEVIVYYSRPQEVLHTSTLLLGPLPCYGNMTGIVWWRLKDHVNGSVIIPKYVREPSQDQQSFLTYP